MGEPVLSLACPPKINLYLRIVRKREDGFHELETVFQSVGGGDLLSVSPAAELSLSCNWANLAVGEDNLVVKAARLLQRRYPAAAEQGAALHLEKRTPMGAGMGGGSVNAAAALVLLSRLWNLPVTPAQLAEYGAELGSDVPFFFTAGTAFAGGRGEKLEPLPTPGLWLVLLRPPVSVNTGWAYGRWRAAECSGPSVEEFIQALRQGDPAEIARLLRNDLEPGVAAGTPEIAAAREWLLAREVLGARMTGSGSVVFGIARDEAQAREIAAAPDAPGLLWTAPAISAEEAALR